MRLHLHDRKSRRGPALSTVHHDCTRKIPDAGLVSISLEGTLPSAFTRKRITVDTPVACSTARREVAKEAATPPPSHRRIRFHTHQLCRSYDVPSSSSPRKQRRRERRPQRANDRSAPAASARRDGHAHVENQRPDANAKHRERPHDDTASHAVRLHQPASRQRDSTCTFARTRDTRTRTLVARALREIVPHDVASPRLRRYRIADCSLIRSHQRD